MVHQPSSMLDSTSTTLGDTSVAKKTRAGTSKQVDGRTTQSLLHNSLGLIIMPFVAVAFWIITLAEMAYYYTKLHFRPGIAPAWRNDLEGEQQIQSWDPDTLTLTDWMRLREEYVEHGVPFVLRRANGRPLSAVAPPASVLGTAFNAGCIRVAALGMLTPLPGLDELIGKLFPHSTKAYWPLWFLGKYTQGKAHVDLGPHVFNWCPRAPCTPVHRINNAHVTHMQRTCNAHATHMQRTCNAHAP